MLFATAQVQCKALELKHGIDHLGGIVAKCKSALRFGQVTVRYVLSYVSVAKISTFLSPFLMITFSELRQPVLQPSLLRDLASETLKNATLSFSSTPPQHLNDRSQRTGHPNSDSNT